ncbi:MAG: transcriptional regulator [Acidobacteria bacterium]|nr:MAG: transcriptional regulator [Acidobacteriota bacterium]MCL4286481.1 helix-turn-helix transcriptional regulator [Thermoleophilia bacterium]GIK77823.1 MAG: HxlR family transcriptional regulator [Actinomycetes bacterium]
MKGYGQFCPVAKASEVLAERWTLLVVRELLCGSNRFNEIQRGVPLMSRSLLAKRLRELEQAGIVERRRGATGRVSEYHLTAAGEELRPIVMGLGEWGQRWARSELSRNELDPRLTMWDMQRNIEIDALPPHRVVIRFRFTDVDPKLPRVTWLVLDGDDVDVCYRDPGYEVDLVVAGRLRVLIGAWMGDFPLTAAIRDGDLRVEGPSNLVRAFPGWLRRSVFAGVERPEPVAAP